MFVTLKMENVRTIIGVIIGLTLIGCTNELPVQDDLSSVDIVEEKNEDKPVNLYLGCWEEGSDSSIVYWCFDSNNVNRDGYVHPYSFEADSLIIAALSYISDFKNNGLELTNLYDSSKIILRKSELTESPDVF